MIEVFITWWKRSPWHRTATCGLDQWAWRRLCRNMEFGQDFRVSKDQSWAWREEPFSTATPSVWKRIIVKNMCLSCLKLILPWWIWFKMSSFQQETVAVRFFLEMKMATAAVMLWDWANQQRQWNENGPKCTKCKDILVKNHTF